MLPLYHDGYLDTFGVQVLGDEVSHRLGCGGRYFTRLKDNSVT